MVINILLLNFIKNYLFKFIPKTNAKNVFLTFVFGINLNEESSICFCIEHYS